MHKRLQTLLLALLLCGLLLALPVALAQDDDPAEPPAVEAEAAVETGADLEATADEGPVAPGTATLIFLVGLGAVTLVGGAMWARDNFTPPDESAA